MRRAGTLARRRAPGRPRRGVPVHTTVRLQRDLLVALDAWAARIGVSRTAAMELLLVRGLHAEGLLSGVSARRIAEVSAVCARMRSPVRPLPFDAVERFLRGGSFTPTKETSDE